jgi:hypothetical protein
MDIDSLRECIASALEQGRLLDESGLAMESYEGLFLMGADLPPLGLVFDPERRALVAMGFVDAFRHPLFVPFDMDMDWHLHSSGNARICATEYLLRMAGALRVSQLPALEERVAKFAAPITQDGGPQR